MTEPTVDILITQAETIEGTYGSTDPTVVGQAKLDEIALRLDMSEDEIQAAADQAKEVVRTYGALAGHQRELNIRKARLVGFKSAALALDVNQFAAVVRTTPELIAGALNGLIAVEEARVAELQNLLATGTAPDKPILNDPSAAVVDPTVTP